jgi:cobalt-zinc-cadmium efflux system membrane fusion protein
MQSKNPASGARSSTLMHSMALAGLLAASLALTACGKNEEAAAKAAPAAAAAQEQDPLEVRVTAEMAPNFAVKPVARAQIAPLQEVSGRIEANERQVTRIGAAVTGRVTEVLVEVGDRVRAGQVLARVASPELTTAQLAYLRAHSAATLAERGVERARQLIAADVIGSAELQRRESELSIARAQLRDKGTLQSHAAVLSTGAGVVIERKVSSGQVAQPGDPLFTVADLATVWVVGAIPEQMASGVRAGQAVEISVPALGERNLSGQIIHVGDTVTPETRTVTIRTQVDNPERDLKPQMLATMRIQGESRELLAVPADAVVRENDRDHVFVQKAENHYRLTPVELGAASGGMRPVVKGVAEGTVIVTTGAFHLNNERKRAELE